MMSFKFVSASCQDSLN